MNSGNIFGAIIAIMGIALLVMSQAHTGHSTAQAATHCEGNRNNPCVM